METKTIAFPVGGERIEALASAAQAHVLRLWNERHDARLAFHNYAQAAEVAERVAFLAREERAPDDAAEVALLAAWFFNIGYLENPAAPADASAIRAEFFLVSQRCAPELIRRVRGCIAAAYDAKPPGTPEAMLLRDAIALTDWGPNSAERLALLRLELEWLEQKTFSDAEWRLWTDAERQRVRFYTSYAKRHFEPALALLQARNGQAEETERPRKRERKTERFERLARRPLRSSIQTYFRANYANHIRLSAIADNKAHIMISVNSILLSVAISLLTYQTLTNRNPLYVLPIILFLVTSLTSLTFAVLSSRPRVTSLPPTPGQTPSPVFFGSFVHLTLDQYEEATDAMLRDGRLLFGNMTRDLYYLGQVLDKKYRLLTYSYTVFLMGFVATVGAFLGAYFLE
ncbi:MAG: DUF5706 domain-containing protein [Saprospiraceae bacterium]|nr:DUF5706 domain-containing protein [Saprospiraceae bacterium]MDW8230127.1 DUF5706 domain-containing protein [Saprospiraceae bacterium]